MSDGQGVVRAVSWRDLCPWLIIFRTFGLSIRTSLLLTATLAVLITPLGWNLAAVVLFSKAARQTDPGVRATTAWPVGRLSSADPANEATASGLFGEAWSVPSSVVFTFHSLSAPFRQVFRSDLDAQHTAYYLFGSLWTLAVWAFFGGVITRVAAVELGREERLSLKEAVVFTARKYLSYLLAPLSPLGVVLVILLLSIPVGWMMRADVLAPLVGLLWIFVLLGGFVSAVVLLGLLFGWPLMWTTVSAEGTDAFDALSRGYAYTFQQPLRYLFYVAVAVLFGGLCWLLVSLFADAVIELAYWAASWGAGTSSVARIKGAVAGALQTSGLLWFGAALIALGNGLVRSVAVGFAFSFFWCAATAVYLLLRYDVDQTEFDEVHMDHQEVRYGLPPLVKDAAGVPAVPRSAEPPRTEADGEPAHADAPQPQPNTPEE
jgi:hypothetical protein